MTPAVKNVIVFIAAAIVGSMVNMALVTNGHLLIPYPEGVDLSTPEAYNASISLLQPREHSLSYLLLPSKILYHFFITATQTCIFYFFTAAPTKLFYFLFTTAPRPPPLPVATLSLTLHRN